MAGDQVYDMRKMMEGSGPLIFDISTRVTEAEAYQAGFDAAVNKPNTNNCHFTLFRSRELTSAWERGNASGREWQQTRMG